MKVLIVVDVQNDFCQGGSMPFSYVDDIIPTVNKLMNGGKFDKVVATKNWHPIDHSIFKENGGLLPKHCIAGEHGSNFHPDLDQRFINLIIHKGIHAKVDSHSAFYDNDADLTDEELKKYTLSTGLDGMLTQYVNIEVYICGIGTDDCIKKTAIDSYNYVTKNTFVITDTIVGKTVEGEIKALEEMENIGVKLIPSQDLI